MRRIYLVVALAAALVATPVAAQSLDGALAATGCGAPSSPPTPPARASNSQLAAAMEQYEAWSAAQTALGTCYAAAADKLSRNERAMVAEFNRLSQEGARTSALWRAAQEARR